MSLFSPTISMISSMISKGRLNDIVEWTRLNVERKMVTFGRPLLEEMSSGIYKSREARSVFAPPLGSPTIGVGQIRPNWV